MDNGHYSHRADLSLVICYLSSILIGFSDTVAASKQYGTVGGAVWISYEF